MENIKITKQEMEILEHKSNTQQYRICDDNCTNPECEAHTVIEKEYETKNERHVYQVCAQCGNTEKINI